MKYSLILRLVFLICIMTSCAVAVRAHEPAALMPHVEDHTQMWWAEGFPGTIPTAPWLRVIQTGRYAVVLNTETLSIQHFGAVSGLKDDWRSVPAAELTHDENTWRMIQREALGNDRRIEMKHGKLQHTWPAITISTESDQAEFTLTHGLGYVPVTFTGLSSPRGYTLFIDDKPLNQSIHGNDFWQTNYDAESRNWSQTYNVPVDDEKPHVVRFAKHP